MHRFELDAGPFLDCGCSFATTFFLTFIDHCVDLDRSVAIAAFVGKARSSMDGLEADLFGRVRLILQ